MRRILTSAAMLTLLAGSLLNAQVHAELAVIVHPSSSVEGVTQAELSDLYLGKKTRLSNGAKVQVSDHAEGSAQRVHFYKTLMKKSEAQIKRYWSKRMFSGKGTPPITLDSNQAVKDWVEVTPNGLGYIDTEQVDGKVKVLLILP